MKIMITGSNGFIGTYISNYLENQGHEILRVVRHKENPCDVKRFCTLDFEKMEASQHLFQAVDFLASSTKCYVFPAAMGARSSRQDCRPDDDKFCRY